MATRYWVGGAGTWSSTNTANWSASSGGASGASVPATTDTVIFDSASGSANYTVTFDGTSTGCGPLTINGPSSGTLTFDGGNQLFNVAGSLTVAASGLVTFTSGNFSPIFTNTTPATCTTNGVTLTRITIDCVGTTLTLGSALTGQVVLSRGTFDTSSTNNWSVTSSSFTRSGTQTSTHNLNSSVITLTGSSTAWSFATTTNLTMNASNSTITLTSSTAKTFAGGGLTYGTVNQGGSAALTISGSNTFSNIGNTYSAAATTITFTISTTQTVSNFTAAGSSGKLLTINSSTAGTVATLSKSSGIVSSDYLSIRDSTATGGATWYAGANSTNVSNNSGWIFTAPPAGSTGNFFLLM